MDTIEMAISELRTTLNSAKRALSYYDGCTELSGPDAARYDDLSDLVRILSEKLEQLRDINGELRTALCDGI